MMPQPGEAFELIPSGEASQPQPSAEDSFLDLFAEVLEGIKFYGGEDNKKFFGTKDKPGALKATVQQAIDIWSSHGKLQVKVTPDDVLNYSFVNG